MTAADEPPLRASAPARRRKLWRRLRRFAELAATIAVSGVLLWLALHAVSPDEMARVFRRARPLYLAPIAATFAVQYWLIALR